MSSASDYTSAELVQLVQDALSINRLFVAAMAFMAYDYCLTLGDEITYMWYRSQRIEWARIIFFINRYIVPLEFIPILYGNLLPNPTQEFCHAWYLYQEFATLVSLAIVELCLLLRTWALYGSTRNMIIFLAGLFLVCAAASASVIATSGSGSSFLLDDSLTALTGCDNVTPFVDRYWTVWLPIGVFDGALCVLSVLKIREHRKEGLESPLLDLLHRDGLTYFALSLSISTLNMVMYAVAPMHLKVAGVPIFQSVLSVACSRMLLNVRAFAATQRALSDKWPLVERVTGESAEAAARAEGISVVNEIRISEYP